MPIHRLTTRLDRNGTMWISPAIQTEESASLSTPGRERNTAAASDHPGEIYYLGLFMVGAYQDIMGDLAQSVWPGHEVHVFLDPDEESGWYIEEVIEGSTIGKCSAMSSG